jgi:hypothetical protein
MVVYIYYIAAAGHSISSPLDSPCQDNWYGTERQAVRPLHHKQNHTCWATLLQPARRATVLGQPTSLRSHEM